MQYRRIEREICRHDGQGLDIVKCSMSTQTFFFSFWGPKVRRLLKKPISLSQGAELPKSALNLHAKHP